MKQVLRLAGFSLLLVVVALGVAACQVGPLKVVNGSGHVKTETRAVGSFAEVELHDLGTLVIEQGSTESLTIEADDNLLQFLSAKVGGGTLVLDAHDETILRPKKEIRYRLTVKDLRAIRVSGSGNVEVAALRADKLELAVSGSGDLEIEQLTAAHITVDLSGSGDADLAGTVDEQEVTVSGSGDYQADGLASKRATVRTSGSGNATVRVADTLKARASGSGYIGYIGAPQVDSDASGSGNIRRVQGR